MGVTESISTMASLCGIAGFATVGYGWLRRRLRHLDAVTQLGADELTPGPAAAGASMRDDVTAILTTLIAQGADIIEVQKHLAQLGDEVRDHVRRPHARP